MSWWFWGFSAGWCARITAIQKFNTSALHTLLSWVDGESGSPQNFSGASQQNNIAGFSTEVDVDLKNGVKNNFSHHFGVSVLRETWSNFMLQFFKYVSKQSPSSSVVWENVETLFYCGAPEVLCELGIFTQASIGRNSHFLSEPILCCNVLSLSSLPA